MLKLTDLTLYCNYEFNNSTELLTAQEATLGYAYLLQERLAINVIKHVRFRCTENINKVRFDLFKGRNRFGYLSIKTVRHLRSQSPDIILLQGLIFPVQVLLLKWILGKKPLIIVQHHGELPFSGFRHLLQKLADNYISAYIFTSLGNSKVWLENKVISTPEKCHEILEASTKFTKQDKVLSKSKTGTAGDWNFLWVGRLNVNKDPLTVLRAFEKYLEVNSLAKFYMIFNADDMLEELIDFVGKSPLLSQAVSFVGKINHYDVQYWYSAADFFISGSHREGSGFALIEAMSCGCVPLVTDIPTFRTITGDGKHAILFEAGNSEQLFNALKSVEELNRQERSDAIVEHFNNELSFKAIADRMYELVMKRLNL